LASGDYDAQSAERRTGHRQTPPVPQRPQKCYGKSHHSPKHDAEHEEYDRRLTARTALGADVAIAIAAPLIQALERHLWWRRP